MGMSICPKQTKWMCSSRNHWLLLLLLPVLFFFFSGDTFNKWLFLLHEINAIKANERVCFIFNKRNSAWRVFRLKHVYISRMKTSFFSSLFFAMVCREEHWRLPTKVRGNLFPLLNKVLNDRWTAVLVFVIDHYHLTCTPSHKREREKGKGGRKHKHLQIKHGPRAQNGEEL